MDLSDLLGPRLLADADGDLEFFGGMALLDPEDPRPAGSPRRVLVVDDNHDAADTMGMLLSSLGYETRVVYDGIGALRSVGADTPDVVLLDLGLPDLSGIEVAQRICADMPAPPRLIAFTGYGHDSIRDATAKAGFQAHLIKPVDCEQLTAVLKKVFA